MASGAGRTPLSLLSLLSLLLLSHASPNLLPSDHRALSRIKTGLGLNFISSQRPCDSAGVTCERRRIPNNTYVFRITRLVFRSQHLSGILPPAIGKLSELKELSLAGNLISGLIPPEISRCRKLEILELDNNRFSGEIPPQISSLIQLRILDLSSNEFSGNLNFLKQFPNLEKLSLSHNMFSGKVPETLRSFRNLRFFNISNNSLLEGPIPVANWIEYSSTDATDEDRILRRYMFAEDPKVNNQGSAQAPSASQNVDSDAPPTPAPAPAPAPTATTTTESHNHKKHKKDTKKMILGFVIGAVGGVVCGVLLSALYKLIVYLIQGREMASGLSIYSPLIKKTEHLAFLEAEDGVSSLEVIGRGGCGEVYKAEVMGTGGKILAIKRIVQPSREATELTEEDTKLLNKFMRQIRSEIQTVGHIRHRNLLPLLAHLARPNCHYLVYEFMKNGSLQDMMNQVSLGTRGLDWLSRHKIALGIASGLEYLHVSHNPRIIHRDLKPANILLDDDMEAKITDFGLAKAMPTVDTHVTTSKVAGTVGYIAPEYHQTLKFTDKCDIYSFGIVLGVLVMGKLPSDDFFQTTTEMSLVGWMRNVMTSDDPTIAIDPKLKGNGYDEQILLVLKIACFCTLEDPKQRPNSKDVRCMLSQIIH